MAPTSRRSAPPVAEALVDDAHRFDFYEAVRLLERMHPDRAAVGTGRSPSEEPVRFRAHTDMGFPASDVVAVEAPTDDTPAEMTVAFMSLAGPHGPLPDPYTERLQDRARTGDTALRDFLDLLAHRPIALQYRSRRRHHVGMEADSPSKSTVARYLRAVAGLGPDAAQGRLAVPDHALLRYAALLNQSPRSAHGLSSLLGDYFAADVEVTPLRGTWMELEEEQQTRLGVMGHNHSLGDAAVLGDRAWDQQAGLTVELRSLSYGAYLGFLPGGTAHRALVDLSELYLGRTTDLDLTLTVDGDAVPETPLSTVLGPRLGDDAWLGGTGEGSVSTQVEPVTFTPEQEVLRIPLFAGLGPGQLEAVVQELPVRQVPADEHVVRQGQAAEAFFVVMEGAADVRYQSPEADEATVLKTLEPGGVFGDEALVKEETYSGSLVTTRASRLLVVDQDHLRTLRTRYPAIERALDATYGGLDAGSMEQKIETNALDAVPSTGLGAHVPKVLWRPLLRDGRVQTVPAGEQVFREDNRTSALVVLLDGGPMRAGEEEVETPGSPLNLEALIGGASHPPLLRAVGDAAVLILGLSPLRRLLRKHPPLERALRAWRAEHPTRFSHALD